jgi:hypothetical protein
LGIPSDAVWTHQNHFPFAGNLTLLLSIARPPTVPLGAVRRDRGATVCRRIFLSLCAIFLLVGTRFSLCLARLALPHLTLVNPLQTQLYVHMYHYSPSCLTLSSSRWPPLAPVSASCLPSVSSPSLPSLVSKTRLNALERDRGNLWRRRWTLPNRSRVGLAE